MELLESAEREFISFKAQLPIFIARQFYRHKGIMYTERSGRYTAENTQFYKPDNWRKAPPKATQGSIENEFISEKKIFGFLNYTFITKLMFTLCYNIFFIRTTYETLIKLTLFNILL